MEGYGTDNGWSFLNMYQPDVDTIMWGFKSHPEAIHVISSEWLWDWNVIALTFESMLARNPYNLAELVGWLAESWETTTWVDPADGETKSKLIFTLQTTPPPKFHDGSLVTPDDVKFTIEFTKACGPGVAWLYVSVMDVHHVEIVDNQIVVYMDVLSYWALEWIGLLPILNKDLWMAANAKYGWGYVEGMMDHKLFTKRMMVREYHQWKADANDNGIIDLKEDGTGPWIFVEADPLLEEHVALKAFREFHKSQTWVSEFLGEAFRKAGDVNLDAKIDITDLSLIARALGTTPDSPPGTGWDQWNEKADLNNDGKVDIDDLVIAGKNYGKVGG